MKKAFLFLTMAVLLLMTACSNKSGNEAGPSGEDGEIGGEITVWGWDVAAETFKASLEKFNKEYPDVKVKVEDFSSGDLYEKLTVGLVSRGAGMPDVILLEDERIPGYLQQFPDGFVDLAEMGYDEHEGKFSESKWELVHANGKLAAAPWDIGPAAMFYRTDIFEKAGVKAEDIKTWDDYLDAGVQIKEETGVKMLPIDVAGYTGVFEMMMQEQGKSYFDHDGKIDITSEEAVRSMEMIKKFYDAGIVLNNSGWNGIVTATVNGDVATVPYGAWYTGTIMDQGPDLSGKWDMFYLPEFKEGSSRYANVGGSAIAISEYSKNKSAAYAFVEFFTTDEETQLLGFEKYGLFPSLKSTFESPIFTDNNEYFSNTPIFKRLADSVEQIPTIKYTEYNAKAAQTMENVQATILLDNKPIEEALEKGKKQLENEMK